MTYDSIELVSLKVKRDKRIKIPVGITQPADVYPVIKKLIGNCDREYFVVLMLDIKRMPTSIQIVAMGSVNEVELHPREIFKGAIASNSSAIILAHNHPSGDFTPSDNDIDVTKKLIVCGKLLGIPILDHLIFTDKRMFSFKSNEIVKFN